jgi:hypothetical protein
MKVRFAEIDWRLIVVEGHGERGGLAVSIVGTPSD